MGVDSRYVVVDAHSQPPFPPAFMFIGAYPPFFRDFSLCAGAIFIFGFAARHNVF
jgi:hypothetical protein